MSHVPPTEPTTERWSALGGVLLSGLYIWVVLWLALAVLLPAVGFGWKPVVITSGSMAPLIRPGDIVLTAADPVGAEIAPGHVITYEDPARPGSLTTHRVVRVQPDGSFRTRGDANAVADSTPIPPENVVGQGRLLVPMIGLPLLWLSGGLLLFALWVGITVTAVVVVTGRGGTATAVPARRATPQRRGPGRVADGVRRWRPAAAQARLEAVLSRHALRLLDTVERGGQRTRSVPMRRVAPVLVVGGSIALFARTSATTATGVALLLLVAGLDPGGLRTRLGRSSRRVARASRVVASTLPTAILGRGFFALVGVLLVTSSLTGRSVATFSAATSNDANSFAAASSFAFGCVSGSTTLVADADTYIDSSTTANYGTALDLLLRSPEEGSGTRRRVLVGFDLSAIPAGADLTSASLRLYQTADSGGTRPLAVHRVTGAWGELTATWPTAPTFDSTTKALTNSSGTPGWRTWNVLPLAETMLAGTDHGFLVKDDTENADDAADKTFSSREGTQPAELVVSWACPLYLQTDPVGSNTTAKARLPLVTTSPTTGTLFNYDTDRDLAAGLVVAKGGSGPSEPDLVKVQRWTTEVRTGQSLTSASVVFHSATKNFTNSRSGTLRWHLRDCAIGGAGCATIATATVSRANWQGGSTTWVEDTADFGPLSHTFAADRELQLVVTVDGASGDDHWFAYGTTSYPARLLVGGS